MDVISGAKIYHSNTECANGDEDQFVVNQFVVLENVILNHTKIPEWSLSCPSPNSCKLPFFAGVSPLLQGFQSDVGGFYAQI